MSNKASINTQANLSKNTSHIPTKRPTIKGAGPIANETAKRISCDCTLSVIKTANGEPVDIGRKSKIWPTAMERAIKERDQHCVWPGCTQSHHLHIHHIKHWADGGTTSINNGVCLCSHLYTRKGDHTWVHEGGYAIERVDDNDQTMHVYSRKGEQFLQQQHKNDLSQFDFESDLCNSRASFNAVRKLSPTRYRFRVVDAQVKDGPSRSNPHSLGQSSTSVTNTKNQPTPWPHSEYQPQDNTRDYTCVESAEPIRSGTKQSLDSLQV